MVVVIVAKPVLLSYSHQYIFHTCSSVQIWVILRVRLAGICVNLTRLDDKAISQQLSQAFADRTYLKDSPPKADAHAGALQTRSPAQPRWTTLWRSVLRDGVPRI